MKKYLILILIGIFQAFSFADHAHAAPDTDFTLSAGIRVDDFRWNIAGDTSGSNPNILSELTWKDLNIFEVKAKARTTLGKALYLRGMFGYGWIYDGDNQDSDFAGDNRTLEFSRSNNKANSGEVWDTSAGAGIRYRLYSSKESSFDFIPMVGYSFYKQNLRITDGFQTLSVPGFTATPPPPVGPFSGLNSTYKARWHGPWAGVDLEYNLNRLNLYGAFEYHLATYRAEADWNLRTNFQHPKSFEHLANGNGVVGTVGAAYALSESWYIDGSVEGQSWQTSHGTDRTFFRDGTVSDTQLNEVVWHSYALMLGLKYKFK